MNTSPKQSRNASSPLAVYLFLCCLLPVAGSAQSKGQNRPTEEIFRVSRVGQRGAAETRELLALLYRDAASAYDAALKAELAKKNAKKTLEGERIRVIRKLKQENPDGNLYLCAYNGSPSVFRISGKGQLQGGKLSPPLNQIEENGEHTMEITRFVVEKVESGGPAFEKVEAGSGVTFFGIPLDSGASEEPPSKKAPKAKEEGTDAPKKREVTETKTLPLFSASISTIQRQEPPPLMSQPLFLKMLKNGEMFSVQKNEERRCQNCRGFGKVTDTRPPGSRSPDGKMDCKECKAVGKIKWNVTYQVGW